ncbi:restriction endonuclease [Nocardia abscessus]|uniref:NaeI family type II restriction endonuclease n=1 Tax=Nocardia abscessus TaxID=120957 RepID=UPI00189454F9|nr:NaeI family type II restriction endonuclease [Nocardia abscessus]MBF6218041.1 restriction endonuclease [Nocardia abscessus]
MSESGALFEVQTPSQPLPVSMPAGEDPGLEEVVAWFRGQKNLEARFAGVFRQAIDEVLDGQRTGRFDISWLAKTEKTYLGTKVEIVVRAAFELPPGDRMDYKVAGHDIDAKFSLTGAWAIPTEAMGHLCLLMAANDRRGLFDVGIMRIRPEVLNKGFNKDGKTTITKNAKESILWLARNASLPRNLLLSLPEDIVAQILNARSGQQRINELLRCVQGVIIDRNTAVTVAQQHDGLKRCRDARPVLRQEGIAVLGHQNDSPKIARALELPVPAKGTFIAVRLVRVSDSITGRPTALIDGHRYAVAHPQDPVEYLPDIHY